MGFWTKSEKKKIDEVEYVNSLQKTDPLVWVIRDQSDIDQFIKEQAEASYVKYHLNSWFRGKGIVFCNKHILLNPKIIGDENFDVVDINMFASEKAKQLFLEGNKYLNLYINNIDEDWSYKIDKIDHEYKVSAKRCYQEALLFDKNNPHILNNLGIVTFLVSSSSNPIDKGLDIFKKIIELHPDYDIAQYNQGLLFEIMCSSIALLKNEETKPRYSVAQPIGVFYEIEKNYPFIKRDTDLYYKEAISAYNKCIKINPNNLRAHTNKALMLSEYDHLLESVSVCEKIISIQPDLGVVNIILANTLSKLGRHEESLSYYNIAMKSNENIAFLYKHKRDEEAKFSINKEHEEVIKGKNNDIEEYRTLRKEIEKMPRYKQWKKDVREKCNNICQIDGSANRTEVHHLESFYSIVKRFKVSDVYKALECKQLWDINNGQLLCKDCHDRMESSKQRIAILGK